MKYKLVIWGRQKVERKDSSQGSRVEVSETDRGLYPTHDYKQCVKLMGCSSVLQKQ